jgi:hypothetical protein
MEVEQLSGNGWTGSLPEFLSTDSIVTQFRKKQAQA